MTSISSISSNFLKKSIPLYASTSNFNPLPLNTISKKKLNIVEDSTQSYGFIETRIMAHDPTYILEKSPPEIPTAPPTYTPGVPPEMPRRPNIPDFDPIPPEKPADPPPLSPGPNPGPEFPGPPDLIPPTPEAPRPPGEPEVVPPHGPDVVPPNTPEPGPPHPTQPDIAPHIMGSNGLAFY